MDICGAIPNQAEVSSSPTCPGIIWGPLMSSRGVLLFKNETDATLKIITRFAVSSRFKDVRFSYRICHRGVVIGTG
jgi:hypothetical protein